MSNHWYGKVIQKGITVSKLTNYYFMHLSILIFSFSFFLETCEGFFPWGRGSEWIVIYSRRDKLDTKRLLLKSRSQWKCFISGYWKYFKKINIILKRSGCFLRKSNCIWYSLDSRYDFSVLHQTIHKKRKFVD